MKFIKVLKAGEIPNRVFELLQESYQEDCKPLAYLSTRGGKTEIVISQDKFGINITTYINGKSQSNDNGITDLASHWNKYYSNSTNKEFGQSLYKLIWSDPLLDTTIFAEMKKESAIQQPNKPKPTTMLPDNMQWAWDPDAADWVAVLKDNNNTTPPLYDPQNQNVVNNTTTYMSSVKSSSSLSVLPKLLDKCWYGSGRNAGKYAEIGNWKVGLGGYDTGYEVYYKNTPIFSITPYNELKCYWSDDRLQEEFGFTYSDIENVLKSYKDLEDIKVIKASKKVESTSVDGLDFPIKTWYTHVFKQDKLGEEIDPNVTFQDVLDNPQNVYKLLGVGDSTIRERVFTEISRKTNKSGNDIYNRWLGQVKSSCLSQFLDGPRYSKEIKIEAGLIKDGLLKYAGFDFNRGTKYAITTKGLEVLRRASEAEHNEALNEREKLAYMFGFNTNKETTLDTTGKVIKSDELSKCEWCGEEFDESELEDTELGKVCYRCKKGIESKEGSMNNKNISEAKQYLEKYLLENPELFKYQYGKDNVEEVLKELIEENPNWYKKFSSKKWTICEADGTPLGKVTASSELDAKVKFGIEHPEYADSQSISAKEIKSGLEYGGSFEYNEYKIDLFNDIDGGATFVIYAPEGKTVNHESMYKGTASTMDEAITKAYNIIDGSKEINAQYEQTTETHEPYPNPSETPHDDIVLENHDGWVNTAEQKVTPEFAQLHSILGEYKKNGHILSITQDGKDLLVSCSPIASYEMKQKFEQLGYECEETDESETGNAYDLPSYTLRIKMK